MYLDVPAELGRLGPEEVIPLDGDLGVGTGRVVEQVDLHRTLGGLSCTGIKE
jgi:hypothetical protein